MLNNKEYQYVGIDWGKGGWIATAINSNYLEIKKFYNISDICNSYKNAKVMLIDIPIGLPESKEESIYRPDIQLRQLLKGKASSVFPVPCRQAVYEIDKFKAKEINIKILGKSLSEQSIGICKCIREVDLFLQNNPEWKNRLMESHPEYCFSIINNNVPILEKKINEDGQRIRKQVLKRHYNDLEAALNKMPKGIKIDDALDALSLAIMAKLIDEYEIKTIPLIPCYDKKGLKMQIAVAKI